MKIGLNATCINNRPSGARQRFIGLYSKLIARMPDAEFVVYEPADCTVSSWLPKAENVSARATPIASEGRVKKLIGGLRYWRSSLPAERFDVFEVFNLPVIKSPHGRTLLTIHDLRGLQKESGLLARTAYKLLLQKSLRCADHVITVSQSMKDEILGVQPGAAVSVVHNGLDLETFQPAQESELLTVRQKYALPAAFVLAVGHFEPRKNYLRLIDAIAILRDRGQPCSLVIVGNDSGICEAITARIHAAQLNSSVTILSGLSDHEVRCMYTLCSLFIFPSAYEGFGIPILECMAAGRPMVLSDIPAFREITEDSGVYFPHDDVEQMAHAIETVLSSNSAQERLVAYGKQRVQAFTFDHLGAQLESVYRSLW